MSGALAERVFAEKLERVGFTDVWLGGHRAFGIADAVMFPLFTPRVIELMRRAIPVERHDRIATAVIVKAMKR